MSRNALWLIGGILLVGVFAFQLNQISALKKELVAVRAEITAPKEADNKATAGGATSQVSRATASDGAGLQARLARLERSVAEFTRLQQMLSERGFMPPSEEKIASMQQKFFDPNLSEGDRLNALRLLRRGNQLTDDVVAQSLSMLQSSTNANVRREILQQLQGQTNSLLKQPLLAMLDTEKDQGMRGQLVNSLRQFMDDPGVQGKLWDMALNEPNTRVRDQAREAVTRGPATPDRVNDLMARASNPDAPLDERLLSFRGLRLAKSHTPELVNEFANMAANTTDPIARAKLFKSFNGLTDPVLMAPLVNGLQDPDPIVRQNAVDSLSEFPDPRVQEWLNHLIQNDTDANVKREAHAALERTQRLSSHQTP